MQLLGPNVLDHLGVGVVLAAGHHLTVASPVEVLELACRLPRVVDCAAAHQHQAERTGRDARGYAREPRTLILVLPHVDHDCLIQASQDVVSS